MQDHLESEPRLAAQGVFVWHVHPGNDRLSVRCQANDAHPYAAGQRRIQVIPERTQDGIRKGSAGQVGVGGGAQVIVGEPDEAVGANINLPIRLTVEIKRERQRARRAHTVVSQLN